MRTTLDIDDDVLVAAKDIARRERKSAGEIVSRLARQGLSGAGLASTRTPQAIYGLRPLPKDGRIVSNELVNRLRDDGEY
ncbi:MAG: CopG family transcriptional regulator [Betaproteobacteria bacterium]